MSPRFELKDEMRAWQGIGRCMTGGELVLTPFEQPIEEESRGDPDQYDDNRNFSGGSEDLCEVVDPEGPHPKKIAGTHNSKRFRYFLDGSIRTKYVGEYVEGGLSVPVIVSDISVAVVERLGQQLSARDYRKNLWFIFPHKDTGSISDTTYERIEELSRELEQSRSLTRIDFLKKSESVGDVRTSLLGKVRSVMHNTEHDVAEHLDRSESDWLIMDGAIRKQEFVNLRSTIGLAKSFSRKPVFDIGSGHLTLPAYMKSVKEGCRSAVFKKSGATDAVYREVVFWYVRLRTFPPMEPLGGLVKVDLRATQYDQDFTRVVDDISSELYDMRLPSVYPWPRWPSYVYPIRIAEIYMNSRFLGDFVLAEVGMQLKNAIVSR